MTNHQFVIPTNPYNDPTYIPRLLNQTQQVSNASATQNVQKQIQTPQHYSIYTEEDQDGFVTLRGGIWSTKPVYCFNDNLKERIIARLKESNTQNQKDNLEPVLKAILKRIEEEKAEQLQKQPERKTPFSSHQKPESSV